MFVESALDRERVNVDEILNEIRNIGYEQFEQIKWVVLGPDGKISCIPYEQGIRSKAQERIAG